MVYSSVAVEPALSGNSDKFGEFCRGVGRIVQGSPKKETPAGVAALLSQLLAEPGLLTDAQRAPPVDGYGRHKIFFCPEDRFSVLAMVWPSGVSTPVHDHLTWCAFGIYEGMVEETRFRPSSSGATAVAVAHACHRAGDVAHLPLDTPDIHRIHNPTAAPAVSVHVYGGNFEKLGPNLGRIYAVEG